MSSDALNIYREHLNYQLGEDGAFTQLAIFDPSGLAIEIYGVFDDNTFRQGADTAGQRPKKEGARFILSFVPTELEGFDVYANYNIYLEHENKQFKVEYMEKDSTGAQVLWLV